MFAVTLLLTALFQICIQGANIKFIINDCATDLVLHNYHNYTGKTLTPPPQTIEKGSSGQFEFQYAAKAEFGSVLDANLNYYQKGSLFTLRALPTQGLTPPRWHYTHLKTCCRGP